MRANPITLIKIDQVARMAASYIGGSAISFEVNCAW